MLYHLLYPLSDYFFLFNVTRYITFRSASSFATSFLLIFIFWKFFLKRFKRLEIKERVDMYGHVHLEALHREKRGTPTMGGLLIICAVVISTLLWARWDNIFIWYTIGVMFLLGYLLSIIREHIILQNILKLGIANCGKRLMVILKLTITLVG